MAISMTASDIRPLPGALCRRVDAGGTVYAGEAVYMAADGGVERADGDAGSLKAEFYGIVVADNDGGTVFSDGDAVDVCIFGPITGYSGLTEGKSIKVSDTAGQMDEISTMGGTFERVIVGIVGNASTLIVRPMHTTTATL